MTDPVDAVSQALAALRGRRRPGPPWAERGGRHEDHHRGRGPMRGDRDLHGHHEHPMHGHEMFGGPGGRFGGGPARMRLLIALAEAGDPLSVSDVAEAIGVDQPRASRLIQQGVAMGFVRREADPDDARRTRIVLTDQGRAIAGGVRGARRDAISTALAGLDETERTEFVRLLTKFAAAWPQE